MLVTAVASVKQDHCALCLPLPQSRFPPRFFALVSFITFCTVPLVLVGRCSYFLAVQSWRMPLLCQCSLIISHCATGTCGRVYLREWVAELEDAKALDAHMPDISELLEAARKPKRDNLGGVDHYLARILCRKPPSDMVTAIGRISLGHVHGMSVRPSAVPVGP